MARPLIVLGDKTDHGGTVIGADLTFDIHGKYVARIGDMTVCPKCKGTFPINAAADDLVDEAGNGYARHLDTTACGARLISGQITTLWSDKSSMGDPADIDADDLIEAAGKIAVNTESGICLECLLSAASAGATTVIRE